VEIFSEILSWLARALVGLFGSWWVVISVWAVTDLVRERPSRYRRVVVSLLIAKTMPGLLIVAAALTGSWPVFSAAIVIAVGSGVVGYALERLGISLPDESTTVAPAPGQQTGGGKTR
jgi:hypothetical protein